MKKLTLTAIGGTSLTLALAVSAPAFAASDSVDVVNDAPAFGFDMDLNDVAAKGKRGGNRATRGGHGMRGGDGRWGKRVNGRWHAGMRAPGGYAAYRRPFRGYVLPTYWHNSGFFLNNYSVYYLRAPQQGYRWSRYYDDAVLTDNRGYVYDSVQDVDWDREDGSYHDAPNDRSVLTYDDDVYGSGERVYTTSQSGAYDGTWDGAYVDEDRRVYQGQWNGTYVDENGQAYRGQYTGTIEGEATYVPVETASASYDRRDEYREVRREAPRYEEERTIEQDYSRYGGDAYERCRTDNGLGGAVIGGVVGGVAGNRIAGRGNRTGGTLIGAGVGAVAGALIDKAEDRGQCDRYRPQVERRPVARRPIERRPVRSPARQPRPEDYGYSGGYIQNGYYYPPRQQYYYPQAPQVTTVIVDGGASETTTTTTTYYEDVAVQPRKHKRYKTLKKPGCKC